MDRLHPAERLGNVGPALVEAGAILNRRDGEGQGRLAACVRELDPAPCLPDFREFAADILGWG